MSVPTRSKDAEDVSPFQGGELLGIEALEERARRLAAALTVDGRASAPRVHLRRLNAHMAALRDVYTSVAEDARGGEAPSPAAEWLLDNFFVISTAARDVRHDLPASFFRRLPRVAADEYEGSPRIVALGIELVRWSAGRLDAQRLH